MVRRDEEEDGCPAAGVATKQSEFSEQGYPAVAASSAHGEQLRREARKPGVKSRRSQEVRHNYTAQSLSGNQEEISKRYRRCFGGHPRWREEADCLS